MYRGTSGPLVNVLCIDFGNLGAPGPLQSKGGGCLCKGLDFSLS